MATLLTSPIVRERNKGLFLVEAAPPSTAETILTPLPHRRQVHHNLLVVEPASFLNHECARAFRAANYALRSVRSWQTAVEYVEHGDPEVVLLDLDALDHALNSLNVSARRLVQLLRHASADRQIMLAGVSCRDFCEIEDIMRAGLHLLVPRDASLLRLIQRIDATRMRQAG